MKWPQGTVLGPIYLLYINFHDLCEGKFKVQHVPFVRVFKYYFIKSRERERERDVSILFNLKRGALFVALDKHYTFSSYAGKAWKKINCKTKCLMF